ncbi:hypothetical protein EDEG_00881 [Edhazardia aedis USNM 41457]|uniref:Phosphoglycerate kinase n=1 Tax=Edhazardia aedis (strain USNM 41457) TaxID=1003232 RepID=J8ZZD1_EDHAE|nr:hypothetical protein EDEG_00881 [Edhazardia aedis USNM 41457]|eukprot:EJW05028.1 hypothetical protein EDEG_00881 [Edhazardia aedis USNM 41457]
MKKKSIRDINLEGKRVFLRTDYNVPISNGTIEDDFRIISSYPTIDYLFANGVAQLIIGTHLGRPKGSYNSDYSLKPVYDYIKKDYLGKGVDLKFFNLYDLELKNHKFVMLENLRFYREEDDIESNKITEFKNFMVTVADILVVDAFGTIHRKSASLLKTGLPAYSGLLVEKELYIVNNIIYSDLNTKPIDLFFLGGKKISDKLKLLKNIISKCNKIYIFGAMASTFLKCFGKEIGESYYEEGCNEIIMEIFEISNKHNTKIILPTDFIVKIKNSEIYKNTKIINNDEMIVDIGSESINDIKTHISSSHDLIFLNGTPGIYEIKESCEGTKALILALAKSFKTHKVLVGGGDTSAALQLYSDRSCFYHVSTGGGSLIALLQGDKLPGVEILEHM